MRRKTAITAAVQWTTATVGAELVLSLRKAPSIRVTYDDFCEAPDAALDRVATAADWTVDSGAPFEGEMLIHSLAGNPVRFDLKPNLKVDDRWRREMSRQDRLRVMAIAGVPWAVIRRGRSA